MRLSWSPLLAALVPSWGCPAVPAGLLATPRQYHWLATADRCDRAVGGHALETTLGIANPFNVDAALASEYELARLPLHGGAAVTAFCGVEQQTKDWDERGVCVLKARKGFGKSHLLAVRSLNHRGSGAAARTIFYPQGGRPRILLDALSSLNVVVPRWLHGKESVSAWIHVWQLSILGLLVWIADARAPSLRGYTDWFGSLELLDQVHRENRPEAPDGAPPAVMLTWFMGRILERLQTDDYQFGIEQLKQGLYHGQSDWAIAITSAMARRDKTRIALYLDAPDELVELDPPNLWRNVQQGLLLAIWKFSKSSIWSRTLNVYATVRSEAFGSGQDHPDIALAMGLVMPLLYQRDDLEAMLADRIRQADVARLVHPPAVGIKPIHALCGFADVTHDDRSALSGGRYKEDVFDSILRHTRLVPREVIAIAGAIYEIAGERSFDTVRQAVNAQSSRNISYAIVHTLLGWNDVQHRRFATSISCEAIDDKTITALSDKFGSEGPQIIKFFVQHGLLGTAEPVPQRHRHYYQQRFSYDEVHGGVDSSPMHKDYFFVHPAFKEWIRSTPEQLNTTFERIRQGVIGDMNPFESQPPLLRLGLAQGKIVLKLRTERRMSTLDKRAVSDPLRLLFVALCACRELKQTRLTLLELKNFWARLRNMTELKSALSIHLPQQTDALSDKLRDWAKKINKDNDIKELQRTITHSGSAHQSDYGQTEKQKLFRRGSFVSVSARSSLGAQLEIGFPLIEVNDLDFDDSLHILLNPVTKSRTPLVN